MSRVYDALRQMDRDRGSKTPEAAMPRPDELLESTGSEHGEALVDRQVKTSISRAARLVAVTEPQGLGAEKFRALATRLENLRAQRKLQSLQVTSGISMEGKSLVAANLALTFARRTRSKVLLLEGDLHRPSLASLFGIAGVHGIGDWWAGREKNIAECTCRLDDMPLWFLSAGDCDEQPSHILQSRRFSEAFSQLAALFDWIIVDSTPMMPIADANLWSQLLDGTLLVVREGVASIEALTNGIKGLDNPKILGIVMNEATDAERSYYGDSYYGYGVAGDRTRKAKP